jgi:hypothetical protein
LIKPDLNNLIIIIKIIFSNNIFNLSFVLNRLFLANIFSK